jgi:3-dehydroquinate dehydratase/shikimate dehydrogenase
VSGADLVELRLDRLIDLDVAGALAGRKTPVVVTCRPVWEGGSFRGAEEERRRILEEAVRAGAEYVDVEWQAGFDEIVRSRNGRGIVLSWHDFQPPGRDLADRVRVMAASGAETLKVAVAADRLSDTLPLFTLGREMGRAQGLVLVGMGAAGFVTRALAARFGSRWTYAGGEANVGQAEPERLLNEFRFRQVTDGTRVYGVVGRPVMHSVSPAMHNAGFAAGGFDAVYVPLAAADAADFVTFAEAIGLSGASVTVPYKHDLLARLEDMDEICRAVGAVNTIRMDGRRWVGLNTDVAGFLAPLEGRLDLCGARAAVLGAGGAGRSVAFALAQAGAEVTLYDVQAEAVEQSARRIGVHAGALPLRRDSWDLLVNATPVGMHPDTEASPMPAASLDGRLVYDLVYNPRRTRLLADAETAGCGTLNGLPMLVEQARRQFAWWLGQEPDAALFRSAAEARLAAFDEASKAERTR